MVVNNIKQRKILSLLVKNLNGLKFSQISSHFVEEDKFPYHLKYLLNKNLISKNANTYSITNSGAFQFKYFNAENFQDRTSKLPVLVLIIQYKDTFLLHKDGSNYNLWPIWINYGEKIDGVIENKKIKYGISGNHKYINALNEINYGTNNEVVYDNIWIIYKIEVDKVINRDSNYEFISLDKINKFSEKNALINMLLDSNLRL